MPPTQNTMAERFNGLDEKEGLIDVGDGTELERKKKIALAFIRQELETLLDEVRDTVLPAPLYGDYENDELHKRLTALRKKL